MQELADRVGASQSAISPPAPAAEAGQAGENRRQGKLVGYSLADDHVKTILGMAKEHLRRNRNDEKVLCSGGPDCANCAAKMEAAINKMPQVEKATVSFMTSRLFWWCLTARTWRPFWRRFRRRSTR